MVVQGDKEDMQEVARIKAEFADVAFQEMGAKGAVVEGMMVVKKADG